MISVTLIAGCGGISVSGRVTFSDDDSPVPCGTVCFASDKWMFRGQISPNGTYAMGTKQADDGIPKGEYTVYLLGTDVQAGFHPAEAGHTPEPMYVSIVDPKFLSASTSGLTAKIDGNTQDLNFQVGRNPAFPKDKLP
jgi:hypothetical protein